MQTTDISTLKIHKLTQAQYDNALASGEIDEYAIYLTPDEDVDLTPYATKEELNAKADSSHTHDDRYYTETEIDEKLDNKADTSHNHDTAYDTKGSANTALASAKEYANDVATTAANAVKNDLLNGAGAAYDTLKELGDLIDTNKTAIDALEDVATSKADANHNHDSAYDAKGSANTALTSAKEYADDVASGKADSSHTHDDRYYTEEEINTKLSDKAEVDHSHPDIVSGNGIVSLNESSTNIFNLTPSYASTYANSEPSVYTFYLGSSDKKWNNIYTCDVNLNGSNLTTTLSSIESDISTKADSSHTHDDRYYTESEVDALLESMVLIRTDDIDAICEAAIYNAAELTF